MCPDTTIYAGGLEGCIVTVDYICVLILLYMCPHCFMSPATTIQVSYAAGKKGAGGGA